MPSNMTKEEAIELYESGWWKDKPAREVARLQLSEDTLCMPFGEFHKAVEEALDRPVWTHEFADPGRLLAELDGDEPKPEDPQGHAVDSLAAMMVSMGKDPDSQMIVLGDPDE